MYQHIIDDKRASLSPAQRSRNGFCSTAGRRETRYLHNSPLFSRPSTGKRGDFDPDALRRRVNVGLGGSNPELLHPAKSGDPLEHRVRQRFLQIVASRRGDFFHLGAEEIIVPRAVRIVVLRERDVVEPDFDRDQQPLRAADLEFVEADVGLHAQRIEQNARGANLEPFGDEAGKLGFGEDQSSPRNCRSPDGDKNWTSRFSARNWWPESITSTCPVTLLAPAR